LNSQLNHGYKDPIKTTKIETEKKQMLYKPEVKYCINIKTSLNQLEKIDYRINDITYINNGLKFYSAGEDCIIYSWDLETGKLFKKLVSHENPIISLQNDNNKYIFSGSVDGVLKIWNTLDYTEIKSFDYCFSILNTNVKNYSKNYNYKT
jgi:WD40 repeat protein